MASDREPEDYLSHSAKAVLKYIEKFEEGHGIKVFQSDPEIEDLRQKVKGFRGSLYSAVMRRMDEVVASGGVKIITQSDMLKLIQEIWDSNVSKLSDTEIRTLKGVMDIPGVSLQQLADAIDLSYSQTRRALHRMKQSGVLKIEGQLNYGQLGLETYLIRLENPSLVPVGPYVTRMLFIESVGSRTVYIVVTTPTLRQDALVTTVKSLRNDSDSATCWRMAPGRSKFSDRYYQDNRWFLDLIHWRLMIRRGGGDLIVGTPMQPEVKHLPSRFSNVDLRVMEALIENYDMKASDIQNKKRVSESSAYRRRRELQREQVVLPRGKARIPHLNEVVLVTLSPESAGDILAAWDILPVTYTTLLVNMEDESQRRVLLLAALPQGMARDLIGVIHEEVSKIDNHTASVISAGWETPLRISTLYDRRGGRWNWGAGFFEARTYGSVRREAKRKHIPVDLA